MQDWPDDFRSIAFQPTILKPKGPNIRGSNVFFLYQNFGLLNKLGPFDQYKKYQKWVWGEDIFFFGNV